jgi:ketosteroid isomerase-like protein
MQADILALHQALIDAHMHKDVDALVRDVSDDFVSVSAGEIHRPTRDELAASFSAYLDSTTFSQYRDLCEPVVGFSDDGSIAWAIVQVRVAGRRASGDGPPRDFDTTWAWITLYRRQGDRWLRLVEVSNARPQGFNARP